MWKQNYQYCLQRNFRHSMKYAFPFKVSISSLYELWELQYDKFVKCNIHATMYTKFIDTICYTLPALSTHLFLLYLFINVNLHHI